MPRDGYTNFPPSEDRFDMFAAVARLTKRDQDHANRVEILDEALRHYASFLCDRRDAALIGTLEKFIASEEFIPSIASSTTAGYKGEKFCVELFENGKWRVLWSAKIGNLYQSPGMILEIPALSESDIDDFDGLDAAAEFYADEIAQNLRILAGEQVCRYA